MFKFKQNIFIDKFNEIYLRFQVVKLRRTLLESIQLEIFANKTLSSTKFKITRWQV